MMTELMSFDTRVVKILESISKPAAPFYERLVKGAIREVLKPLEEKGVQVFEDRYGNLVAVWWRSKNRNAPCLALAAHMDHPGFDPVSLDGRTLTANILGGVPVNDGLMGSAVKIIRDDVVVRGHVTAVTEDKKQVTIMLDDTLEGSLEKAFGVFDFDLFRADPPLLHGPAMDDLAGCAIQTAVLERVAEQQLDMDLMVIFHRAEEVGFMGAAAGCEVGTVPRNAVVVSLEASKNLDGARPGEGIVIRTGDRLHLFDPNAQAWLESAAAELKKRGIKTQKRRMDGGTCEASLFLSLGYETTAISVPLINYHNHGENGPEPEAIHIYDLNSAAELIFEAARLFPKTDRVARPRFYENRRRRFLSVEKRLLSM